MALTEEARARLAPQAAEIIGRYPRARSALLPLLHLVQSEEGYVSEDGITFCAEQLGLTEADVTGVVSFYTLYKRRPVGEYHVGVCTTALCAVMGGDTILAELKEHLGTGIDEVTPDGKVSYEHVECNAACDYAPVVMVNWEFFDNMTPAKARDLVDDLRSGADVVPTRGAPRPGAALAHCMAAKLAPGRLDGCVRLSGRDPESLRYQLEVVNEGFHRLAHDVRDVVGRVADPVWAERQPGWPADLGIADHDGVVGRARSGEPVQALVDDAQRLVDLVHPDYVPAVDV